MKIIGVLADNFASYEKLDLGWNKPIEGLTLVYGATGSGKSTLLDAVCWCLFGVTSKNGSVDEVRSWGYPDALTMVHVEVELAGGLRLIVERHRGNSKQNDLRWTEGAAWIRGKDLKDTQRLLEERLGVTADLYLSAAYASEFNPTATFFIANAKTRRQVFESIASLDFAVNLEDKSNLKYKELNKQFLALGESVNKEKSVLFTLQNTDKNIEADIDEWENAKNKKIRGYKSKQEEFILDKLEAQAKFEDFENKREHASIMLALDLTDIANYDICSNCGQSNAAKAKIERAIRDNANRSNPHKIHLDQADRVVNDNKIRMEAELSTDNPYVKRKNTLANQLSESKAYVDALEEKLNEIRSQLSSLTTLANICKDLKAALLKGSVDRVQTDTNDYLERFFDSEFRVSFTLDGSDALEVEIMKSGYPGAYRQLSKGQRQILKLCFTVAVMKASANRAGIHFDNLYFDEPTDGCDADFKVKSFKLFEELALSHSSVLVVDHSTEFKELFSNRYKVSLVNDVSVIETDNE